MNRDDVEWDSDQEKAAQQKINENSDVKVDEDQQGLITKKFTCVSFTRSEVQVKKKKKNDKKIKSKEILICSKNAPAPGTNQIARFGSSCPLAR